MAIDTNILLHIPHSSTSIPLKEGYLIADKTLADEIDMLTDWFTDDLFDYPVTKIVAPFSRLFCDVERFEDDALEIMAKYGMGMCYTRLDSGQILREVSPELRMKIKSEYYDVHHKELTETTNKLLEQHGKIIIVDCHSFSDKPFKRDLNQETPRPDFCIGTDDFHTPQKMIKQITDLLTGKEYSVKINNPYAGTMIPLKYYRKNRDVQGIMIEVNRKLYVEKKDGIVSKSMGYPKVKMIIQEVLTTLTEND